MSFRRICTVRELPPGEALKVHVESNEIALFNVGGEFFAVQNKCSHGNWSLADSYLEGDVVECALHHGRFCVRTGEPRGLPATKPLRVFPVRVENGEVFLDPSADA